MHIQARCSECGYQHALDEKLLGKTVKCKGCSAPFLVESMPTKGAGKDGPQAKSKPRAPEREAIQSAPPAVPRSRRDDDDPDDRPARRRVRDEDDYDDDDRPRRRRDSAGKSSMPLILGAVAAGVLVLGGVVALVIVLMNRSGEPAVAQGNPPVVNPGLLQPPVLQNQPPIFNPQPQAPPEFNPQPQAPPVQQNPVEPPKIEQPKIEQPNIKQPKVKQPRIDPPKIEQAAPAAPMVVGEWKAEPDPGIDSNKTPTVPKKGYPSIANPTIVFPSTPSPFVAIRFGQFGQEQWQVVDLQTGKNPGGIKGKPDMRDEVLSPDGKFLAGRGTRAPAGSSSVNVYSFAANKFLTPIVVATPFLKHHDFVEGNNIITLQGVQLDTKYEVWSKDSGQQLAQYQRKGWPDFKHNAALSPGRKYLALAEGNAVAGHSVVILTASKGDVVGEISLPKDIGNVKAMAFSPDGSELACYFEHFSQGRLVSFKMAKGEVAIDHVFAQSVSSLDNKTFFFTGPIMEWVPDKSGWLFYGQFWIDYPTGAPVYTFPTTDDSRRNPHRFVGKDFRAIFNIQGQAATLSILPVAKEIAEKVKAARAGGEKGPAPLPEPKAADVAAAKPLAVPGGAVAWTVAPDPAPATKALPPLSVRTTPGETAQVMFTDNGQAVVLASIVTNALAQKRFLRADRYNLADGKLLSETVLFPVVDVAKGPRIIMPGSAPPVNAVGEVSSDGTMLTVRASKDDPRLDVWSLQDNKHLAGWLPYDGELIEWFRFIDANRLLTMSAKGSLALWKLPECQQIYVGEGYRGAPQISLGRKYVAVLGPAALEILDTDSGTRRGLLSVPEGGLQTCPAIAFSGDGKALAAVIFNGKGTQVARWNLATGAAEGEPVSAPVATAPLQWAGSKHVLANLTLFDLHFKNAITTYTLPSKGKPAGATPDGRLWFTYETGKDKTLLTAIAVPDPQATEISTAAANGKVAPLIPPGTPVRVAVVSDSNRFKTAIEQKLSDRLQALGFKTGGGGVALTVQTSVSPTGKILEYEMRKAPKFGPAIPFGPGGQLVKVQEKQVVCHSQIVDQKGEQLHKAQYVIPMPHSIRIQGDDIQTELEEAMWNQAIAWGNNAPLPTNLYRINGQLVALPKAVAVQ